jgi:hypothetical protein
VWTEKIWKSYIGEISQTSAYNGRDVLLWDTFCKRLKPDLTHSIENKSEINPFYFHLGMDSECPISVTVEIMLRRCKVLV